MNGVIYKPAVGVQGYDKIHPRDRTNTKNLVRKQLDQCFGSTDSLNDEEQDPPQYDLSTDGVYHYTTFSPCVFGGEYAELSFNCDTDPYCKKSPTSIFNNVTTNSDR